MGRFVVCIGIMMCLCVVLTYRPAPAQGQDAPAESHYGYLPMVKPYVPPAPITIVGCLFNAQTDEPLVGWMIWAGELLRNDEGTVALIAIDTYQPSFTDEAGCFVLEDITLEEFALVISLSFGHYGVITEAPGSQAPYIWQVGDDEELVDVGSLYIAFGAQTSSMVPVVPRGQHDQYDQIGISRAVPVVPRGQHDQYDQHDRIVPNRPGEPATRDQYPAPDDL